MSKEKHSLYRLFSGKHSAYSNLTIGELKTEGSEIGAFFSCSKTNFEKRDGKINFLGKFIKKPVQEKIYMDIVRYFSNGPTTRLACVAEETVKKCASMSASYSWATPLDFEEIIWMGGLKDRFPKVKNGQYLAYLSKLVPGFHNLEDFEVNDLNQKIKFADYIKKYQSFPSTVILNDEEYLLTGIMKIAAVALLTGDKDWLGGSCKNTGAYIENINGTNCAVTINVDVGFAVDTDITPFKISKNVIPYNANYSSTDESKESIHINKLPPEHLSELLKSLYLILYRYPKNDKRMRSLLMALVLRKGVFNEILTDAEAFEILDKLEFRFEEMRVIYSEELEAYAKDNAELLTELIQKEQEKDLIFLQQSDKAIITNPDKNSIKPISSGKLRWSDLFKTINLKEIELANVAALFIGTFKRYGL